MVEGLKVTRRDGLGLALIQARKDVNAGLIGAALGVEAANSPARRCCGGVALIATAPGTWLLQIEEPEENWMAALHDSLAELASVTDQSAAYVVMRLIGEQARVLLQRSISIDLHPSQFSVGSAVSTTIAHIGALIWQIDDQPSFELAFFRSFTASMQHWIAANSAAL